MFSRKYLLSGVKKPALSICAILPAVLAGLFFVSSACAQEQEASPPSDPYKLEREAARHIENTEEKNYLSFMLFITIVLIGMQTPKVKPN